MSTSQFIVASAEGFAALSSDLTRKEWLPFAKFVRSRGEVQAAKAPLSIEHWKEAIPEPPTSIDEKLKEAAVNFVSAVVVVTT